MGDKLRGGSTVGGKAILHAGNFDKYYTSMRRVFLKTTTIQDAQTTHLVEWDAQEFIDSDVFTHNTVTNNDELIIAENGVYSLSARLVYDNTAAARSIIYSTIKLNGAALDTTYDREYSRGATLGNFMATTSEIELSLVVGDTLTVEVSTEFVDSVSPLNKAPTKCSFIASKISTEAVGNSWRPITSTPQAGETAVGISSDWANTFATSGGSIVGTLTKSFVTDEMAEIPLSAAVTIADVSVQKEILQLGLTNNDWDTAVDGSNFEQEDFAYAVTLTPSAVSGNITLTLGSGAFTAEDVGKTITGNGGSAVLTATNGSATTTVDFTNINAIASGSWSMNGITFGTDGAELSFIDVFRYDITSTVALDSEYSVATESTVSGKILFKPDGTKMYFLGGNSIYQYSLTTPWDIGGTVTLDGSENVSAYESDLKFGAFSSDGSRLLFGGTSSGIIQYALTTAWDVTGTVSYDTAFGVTGQMSAAMGIAFSSDGLKLLVLGITQDAVFQYTLSVAWSLSGTETYNGSFSIGTEQPSPLDLAFSPDGTKMFIVGTDNGTSQYTLTTAWDIFGTVTHDGDAALTAITSNGSITFNSDGTKLYGLDSLESIHQMSLTDSASAGIDTQHIPTITSGVGQIDSRYWADINSMTTTNVLNGQTINYAVSPDNRTTWQIALSGSSPRSIVRNNAGTWEYNSNATYGSTTWTAATVNNEFRALSQAMSIAANTMPTSQLEAVGTANFFVLGDELDLAMILYSTEILETPSSDSISINYDGNVLNQGAIVGTDYNWDQPESTNVRITALANNNLKIRVS